MLRTGQCTPDHKRCYILDYKLNLYRFDDDANTFTLLKTGVIDGGSTTGPHYSQRIRGIRVRSTNLSANEKKIYFVNDSATESTVFEWDFGATNIPTELVDVNAIDPELVTTLGTGYRGYTGHDSWDLRGRFHAAAFGGEEATSPNVKVLRVDPVRIKAALGLLPGVPEVSIRGAGPGLHLVRHGDKSTDLAVLLSIDGATPYEIVTMPAGETVVHLSLGGHGNMKNVTVIPDGDTYVVE
ncbi:MAG TPA: hypothetical protein VMS65_17860, partial [Polyangiaceae bacterium]|nr:hypothetical protein [Polyangiaceae bacterium]